MTGELEGHEQVIVVPGAVHHSLDQLHDENGDLLGTLELDRTTCTVRFVPATADEVRAERANWSS